MLTNNNVLKRGSRIALRAKVNDALITGLSVIDSTLPVGRGQRQLILGDRYTGKTSIFISLVLANSRYNLMGIESFGSKRLFCIYVGINQNLSKLAKMIDLIRIDWFMLVIATHSSSPALLSFMAPLLGITLAERLRNKGLDVVICFDDLSKHSKAYRQIALILAKIPSREAYPSDIFNVHSTLLERVGKLSNKYGASISAFPIIETINSDITEFIATNVISITDGQFYTSKELFLSSIRPAIDSALSVSRIGSAAQCSGLKINSVGIKNLLTYLRGLGTIGGEESLATNDQLAILNTGFCHDHLTISSIETSIV